MMRHLLPKVFLTLLGFSVLAGVAANDQVDGELEALQRQWSEAQRQPHDRQVEVLRMVAARVDTLTASYPDKREPAILERQVERSYAAAAAQP